MLQFARISHLEHGYYKGMLEKFGDNNRDPVHDARRNWKGFTVLSSPSSTIK